MYTNIMWPPYIMYQPNFIKKKFMFEACSKNNNYMPNNATPSIHTTKFQWQEILRNWYMGDFLHNFWYGSHWTINWFLHNSSYDHLWTTLEIIHPYLIFKPNPFTFFLITISFFYPTINKNMKKGKLKCVFWCSWYLY